MLHHFASILEQNTILPLKSIDFVLNDFSDMSQTFISDLKKYELKVDNVRREMEWNRTATT